MGEASSKCAGCVGAGRSCDLVPNPAAWSRLEKERQRVFKEWQESIARTERLRKQFTILEERKQKIVDLEMKNIEELEEDERREAAANPLFDVATEQLLSGVDWSLLPVESPQTLGAASGSPLGTP